MKKGGPDNFIGLTDDGLHVVCQTRFEAALANVKRDKSSRYHDYVSVVTPRQAYGR